MQYFLAHWKYHTRWSLVVFIAVAIGLTIGFSSIVSSSVEDYGQLTTNIIANDTFMYVIFAYVVFFVLVSSIEVGNVISKEISRKRIIQEITKKYCREKIFFIKSAYALCSIWWKIIFVGILISLGTVLSGGNGEIYHFIWSSVGAIIFVITSYTAIFLLLSVYVNSITLQAVGWVIMAGFFIYFLIIVLVVFTSGDLAIRPRADGAGNLQLFSSNGIGGLENAQNQLIGTSWFNFLYQFILIQNFFWGISELNHVQLSQNLPLSLQFGRSAFFTVQRYSFSATSDQNRFTLVRIGNILNPAWLISVWLLIMNFLYGMSFLAFKKKDFQ